MAVIRGKWDTGQVWIDDRELSPERSCTLFPYLGRFRWGDSGSGAAQLSLAILLDITKVELAELWYQRVKRGIIAKLPQADFTLDSQEIVDFIVSQVARRLEAGER
jgi:uncharacterized protein DUF6166